MSRPGSQPIINSYINLRTIAWCPVLCSALLPLWLAVGGPVSAAWNSPYTDDEGDAVSFYSRFSERPKHLDPVRSYSANEYKFIAQIYEPPLQYHYLLRPYRLVPLSAVNVPEPIFIGHDGEILSPDVALEHIAYSTYEISIRPGMRYQPHPAFARDDSGAYRYHALADADLRGVHTIGDFSHTGTRDVQAADYVQQIKRIGHPALHSPIRGLMSEHIVGLAQFSARVSEIVDDDSTRVVDLREIPLQGVQAVDRYTIRVTLYGHYPQFVYWLAMPFFAPMPWEAEAFYGQAGMSERNITLDWYPLGSGPYMLTEHNPNRRMVLQRNPHFHGERYPREGMPADVAAGLLADSGEALPFIQRAVYSLERESIPAWNKFVQGYYDVSSIGSDSFDQAVSFGVSGDAVVSPTLRARGIELTTAVSTSSYYMGFNMLDPVLGGGGERARKLRQAISIAVDFEEYISIFANGRGVAAQGPLPPGIFGHRPGRDGVNPVVYRWHRGRVVRRPVEEARQLLAEAGYAGGRDSETGEPLALYFDTTARGPDDKARLDWMRKQFAKLDIQLVVRATDYNRFQETMRNGKAQIFMWGWNADYPDPENFLFLLYGPNGKVRHGGENAANYSNPEFDALFDTMKNLSNGRRRQELIDRMVRLMRSDAPWAWGYHPMDFSLHHGWYANVKPNLMANNTLKYRRIDPQERGLQRQAWNEPVLWPLLILAVLLVLFMVPAVAGYLRRERARVQ